MNPKTQGAMLRFPPSSAPEEHQTPYQGQLSLYAPLPRMGALQGLRTGTVLCQSRHSFPGVSALMLAQYRKRAKRRKTDQGIFKCYLQLLVCCMIRNSKNLKAT